MVIYSPHPLLTLFYASENIYTVCIVLFLTAVFFFLFFFGCIRLLEATWDAIVKNTGIDYRCTT